MGAARLCFVDWLRVFLTGLVVVHHCVWMLDPGAAGSWGLSYQYKAQPPLWVIVIATSFLKANQTYFMGLFFVLAGYFTVGSYNRKAPRLFLQDRAVRLLIPVLVFEVLIGPMMFYIAQPVADPYIPPGLAEASNVYEWYFRHHFIGIGNNPMWFIVVLFIFSLGYCWDRFNRRCCCAKRRAAQQQQQAARAAVVVVCPVGGADTAGAAATARAVPDAAGSSKPPVGAEDPTLPPQTQTAAAAAAPAAPAAAAAPCPPRYTTGFMVGAQAALAFALTTSMFVLRLAFRGAWTGYFINFQLSFIGGNIMCFALGCWMATHRGLERLPGPLHGALSCALGVLLYAGGEALSWVLTLAGMRDPTYLTPGLTFFFALTEQCFAALWGSGLTMLFAAWCNRRPGPWGRRVVAAAYCVYILHPLVIVAYDRALVPTALGPAEFVAALAFPAFFTVWLVSMAIVAIPGANRVL